MNPTLLREVRRVLRRLSKIVDLEIIIESLSPDIYHVSAHVRDRATLDLSFVACAFGIEKLLPFLRGVCQSTSFWQTTHTGISIVKYIAILSGDSVAPHLSSLVKIIEHGLSHDNDNVKTITTESLTALALAAAAASVEAAPNVIEGFSFVIKPLLKCITSNHGKVLVASLKAIRYIVPLMKPEDDNDYTREEIMVYLIHLDEKIKRIMLKVVKQCVSTVVKPDYDLIFKEDVFPFHTPTSEANHIFPSDTALSEDWSNNSFIPFHHAINRQFRNEKCSSKPNTYHNATKDARWIQAMKEEINALESKQTWEVFPLPARKTTIGCKWVYKMKYKANGEVKRFKSRLVAKGYKLRKCIDFQVTFPPMVQMTIVSCILLVDSESESGLHLGPWILKIVD
ncbi:hypothetical protein FXO38_11717 [Capsicum annuum]|nr:hypothetical protein FXO38_11717 [Capsicum annuum]